MGAHRLFAVLALLACAFLPSPAGVEAGVARAGLTPGDRHVTACAAYLPADGAAVALSRWWRDPQSGRLSQRPVGSARIAVDRREGAWLVRLETSSVMRVGLYLDRRSGALAMPGIVAVEAPRTVPGGCDWAARETYDHQTVKFGAVGIAALREPGRCALTARFRKVVHGRALVDEDFVASYACAAPP